MLLKPHFLYRLKLVFVFLLVKLKFLHGLLPKSLRDELPIGWNNHMFWTAFKSGGKKVYFEYYSKMRDPNSYEPKTFVSPEFQLTKEQIQDFYRNGLIGPFDLFSSEQIKDIKEHLINIANQDSNIYSYAQGGYKFKGKENDIQSLSDTEKFYISKLNAWDRHLEDSKMLNIFQSPEITERCAQLLSPNLTLWKTTFFDIPPDSIGTPWHQANTSLNADFKESMLYPPQEKDLFELACWIALTDAPKERSCLKIVTDSHWEIYPIKTKKKQLGKAERIYGNYGEEIDYDVDPDKVRYLEAKAGQCIIFADRAVHASTANITDQTRWSVVGRIVSSETGIHSQRMEKEGFDYRTYGIYNIKLDKWKPIVLRKEK